LYLLSPKGFRWPGDGFQGFSGGAIPIALWQNMILDFLVALIWGLLVISIAIA
jgi:hypothetical protein